MWNKKLQEIKKMNAIFGEEINDGATEKDIQRFLEEIGDVISEEYLHPYINVLKRVNGLEFNGFILYGIDSMSLNSQSTDLLITIEYGMRMNGRENIYFLETVIQVGIRMIY